LFVTCTCCFDRFLTKKKILLLSLQLTRTMDI